MEVDLMDKFTMRVATFLLTFIVAIAAFSVVKMSSIISFGDEIITQKGTAVYDEPTSATTTTTTTEAPIETTTSSTTSTTTSPVVDGKISGTLGTKLKWEIDVETKVLTIDNEGTMVSFSATTPPWKRYTGYFNSVIIKEGCESVSASAFSNCSNITSINLPTTLKNIGDDAFYNCAITNIILPEGLTSIGTGAFASTSLTSITIFGSVTSIGRDAFYSCNNLKTVNYTGTVAQWCTIDFITSYSGQIRSNPMLYADEIFINGNKLEGKLEIPDSVTKINGCSFYHCTSLTSVTIPDSVTSIGAYAFYGCTSLTSVTIPDSVTSIGGSAFQNCTSLKNIIIPDSVKSLGSNNGYTFYGCKALESVIIGNGVKYINSSTFYNCSNLESIRIGSSVTGIASDVFSNCSKLSSIYILNKDYSIDDSVIPMTATIYGYSGSKTESSANELGYNFVAIDTSCKHEYSSACAETCSLCGYTRTTSHTFGEWTVKTEATCTETGIKQQTCSVCGKVNTKEIPLIDHTDENDDGICDVCHKQFEIKYPKSGICGPNLTWKLDENGVLTIEGTGRMYDFMEDRITVPYSDIGNEDAATTRGTTTATSTSRYYTTTTRRYNESTTTTVPTTTTTTTSHPTSTTTTTVVTSSSTTGQYDYSEMDETTTTTPTTYNWLSDYQNYHEYFEYGNNYYVCNYCSYKTASKSVIITHIYRNHCNTASADITHPGQVVSTTTTTEYASTTSPDYYYIHSTLTYYSYTHYRSTTKPTGTITYGIPGDGYLRLIRWNTYCDEIKKVVIGEGVTNIGKRAFSNCVNLAEVEIAVSVAEIDREAFYGCSSLKEVTIPENISNICYGAFVDCDSLTKIDFNAINCSFSETCYRYSDRENNCLPFEGTNIVTLQIGAKVQKFPKIFTAETVIVEEGLANIPIDAFANFSKLQSVKLPSTIITIDMGAFRNCNSLTSINFPDSLKKIGWAAFEWCQNLESIELPESLESINAYAFYGCTNLTDLYIPASVKEIGSYAFGSCYSLNSVKYNATGENIAENTFELCPITTLNVGKSVNALPEFSWIKTVTFEDGAAKVPDYAFIDNESLTTIILPDTIETIGNFAFKNCTSLKDFDFPQNLTKIDKCAFKGCIGLKEIELPSALKEIGDSAFYNCYNIEELNLPENLEAIGVHAFYGLIYIPSITIPESVKLIGYGAFEDCYALKAIKFNAINCETKIYEYYDGTVFVNTNNISSFTIGSKVTNIPNGIFAGITGIKSVELPSSVKNIGTYAFKGCTGLTTITIPENVTNIAEGIVRDCTSLSTINYNAINCNGKYMFDSTAVKTVNIGENVKYIPEYAFTGCKNIEKVIFPDTVIQIDPLAFSECTKLSIVCSNGSYANVFAVQNGIKYTLEDGAVGTTFEIQNSMLLGYSGTAQNIVLPSDITSVGIGAFKDNSTVKSIEIPYNVSKIYSNAFANCSNLEKVILPFTLSDISTSAFEGTNATIYCYYNSYAYKYAVANNINYELITVTLSKDNVSTYVGGSVAIKAVPSITTLSGVPLVWKSSNTAVADVDSKGNIIGKSEGEATIGIYGIDGTLFDECKATVGQSPSIKIITPSTTTVKYGYTLILHAKADNLPEGAKIQWSVDGNGFSAVSSNEGETFSVKSTSKGDATITAKIVDKDGNALKDADGNEISAEQKLTSKAGLLQKIIAFFKNLFKRNMVIATMVKELNK